MVDDADDGVDTVRGGVPPMTTLRGRAGAADDADLGRAATSIVTPLPRPPVLPSASLPPDAPPVPPADSGEPSALAPPPPPLPGLHATRADSPLSRSRADTKPPLFGDAA